MRLEQMLALLLMLLQVLTCEGEVSPAFGTSMCTGNMGQDCCSAAGGRSVSPPSVKRACLGRKRSMRRPGEITLCTASWPQSHSQ